MARLKLLETDSPLDVRREAPKAPRATATRRGPRRRQERPAPPVKEATGPAVQAPSAPPAREAKAPAVQLIGGPRYDLPVIFVAAIW